MTSLIATRRFILQLLYVGVISTGSLAVAAPAILHDQYGAGKSLRDFAGQPVLVIVARPHKLRWIGRWEKTIRAELPQLNSMRIADVTDEPRPDESAVAERLRELVPANVSVLIDLGSAWASAYGLDTTEPCLLLFDAEHEVVASFRGRPKGALVADVMAELTRYFSAVDVP